MLSYATLHLSMSGPKIIRRLICVQGSMKAVAFKSTILRSFICLSFIFILTQQMQAPRTSRQGLVKGRSHANAVAQQALIAHWQKIVNSLNNSLKIMKANYVRSNVSNLLYAFQLLHRHNI